MKHSVLASLGVVASMCGICAGATLYGLTATNLVRFDSSNPANVTVIGPHGLPPGGAYGVNYLTYHPDEGTFFGVYFGVPASGVSDQWLFTVDPVTGAGAFGASLGSTGVNQNYWESIEYVHALGSLVISRGPNTDSQSLSTLTPAGVSAFITNNGRDNDYTAYDPIRNIFYTSDPNGVAQLATTDLGSGEATNHGALTVLLGDLAYDLGDDAIYSYNATNNHLFVIETTNGIAPIAVSDLGPIGGDALRGIAVIPTPCIGDVNGDGETNVADFNIIASNYGDGPGLSRIQGDLSGDGFVKVADFNILASDYGCP